MSESTKRTPEDIISANVPELSWHRPGIIWDPIWQEYAIAEVDSRLQNQLIAVRLQTFSAVYKAISEGTAHASQLFNKTDG